MIKKLEKQMGGKLTDAHKQRYESSPQWKEGKFMNPEPTSIDMHFTDIPQLLYKQMFEQNGRTPAVPLPVDGYDAEAFSAAGDGPIFSWYGHSAVLMKLHGKHILIDPMMGPNASPIAPFKTARFSPSTLDLIDDLPAIDMVMITHDHYDHLDLASVQKLLPKVQHWWVALGVGRHLEAWGVKRSQIKEFDWWDHASWHGIDITCTPSRHFSGRGIADRSKSLWCGWAFKSPAASIYWSGDGGYGHHFKEVGKRLGTFDIGFMECGQYNKRWHQIHMFPEESVQAAVDAGVSRAVPVHWGGFALALHPWTDPISRFTSAATSQNLEIITPPLGTPFSLTDSFGAWWTDY